MDPTSRKGVVLAFADQARAHNDRLRALQDQRAEILRRARADPMALLALSGLLDEAIRNSLDVTESAMRALGVPVPGRE